MSPQDLAHIILNKVFTKPDGIRLRAYRGEFWRWDGEKYLPTPNWDFKIFVTSAIEKLYQDQEDAPKITTQLVGNVTNSLASKIFMPEETQLPCWVADHPEEAETNLLTMKNGLISLDAIITGREVKVHPHTPAWFSTTALPYEYDPSAKCPGWQDFLNQIFEGDQERIKLLQEWFGYCLTPNTTEQKFLVLEGEGANGKSVVCEILTALLGDVNVSHVPLEVFADRFQLTATLDKLANITTEVGEIKSVAEGILKQFTSGDRMTFDRKNQSCIHARPSARLVLAANNRPKFADRSQGIWRRMILLPFAISIPREEQDIHLAEKLKAELPGILNWAAEGERRRIAQGGFTQPQICRDAAEEYKLESNPAKMFLTESFESDPVECESADEVYLSYRDWCEHNGFKPLSRPAFKKEVIRQFPKAYKTKKRVHGIPISVFQGIRRAKCPTVETISALAA